MKKLLLNSHFAAYLLLLVFVITIAMCFSMNAEDLRFFCREGGPVENASVFFYALAVVVFYLVRKKNPHVLLHTAAVSFIFMLRELDLHRNAYGSFLKGRYYMATDIPMLEKVVAAVCVITILGVIVSYIAYMPLLIKNILKKKPYAFSILYTLLLFPLTELFDDLHKYFQRFLGIKLSHDMTSYIRAFEEMFETAIPIMMIFVLAQFLMYEKENKT